MKKIEYFPAPFSLVHLMIFTIKTIIIIIIIIIGEPRQLSRYRYSLRAGWYEDRIPVRARISASVRTGSEAHPASYTMGTGSFSGVQRPGRGVDHPPQLEPRLKKRYSYISTPSLGLRGLF